ncbi:GntR family transcriptional regulator [Alcanivorax sp. IO_7]|nr:GntR family transcriptional regulator [Alcanivorax sp. IO_7]
MRLHLTLDGDGPRRDRLYRALRRALLDGRLVADERLPPSRALAAELGLGRQTVVEAYERLIAEGFLMARTGSGTFVARLNLPASRESGPAAGAGPGAHWRAPATWGEVGPGGYNFAGASPIRPCCPGRPGAGRCSAPCATRPPTPPCTAIRWGSRPCAPASPITWATAAACRAGRSRCWLPRALSRGWTCWPGCGWGPAIWWPWRSRATHRRGRCSNSAAPPWWACRWTSRGMRGPDSRARHPGVRDALAPVSLGMPLGLSRRLALLERANRHDWLIVEDDYDGEYRFEGGPWKLSRAWIGISGWPISARSPRCCTRPCGWAMW